MFVPLRVRSHYSLGYGTASIQELVDEAVRRELPALALTDVDNLYGQVEFHHACRAAGLKAITGVELGGRVFLARDRAGYEQLCRAVTTREVDGLQALDDPGPPIALISREDHALHALQRAIRGQPPDAPATFDVPLRDHTDIVESCELDLTGATRVMPEVENADVLLERRCGPANERMRRELDVLRRLGFSGYFLIVAEIVEEARRRGVGAAVRGSACSSLVVRALGLSEVDPLAHGLYFERFIHERRADPPDVDIDLASDRRDEIIAWAVERFGAARVGALAAWRRDSIPATGFPASVVERLIGKPRYFAVHPGGLVIPNGPLPMERAAKGVLATQYDRRSVARLGLVKIDLLGNRCLSEIDEVGRRLGAIPEMPDRDPVTLRTLAEGRTIGCFQIESPAMRAVLGRMSIRGIEDLMDALAIVRPGPASGRAKEAFLRGRRDLPLYEEDLITLLMRDLGLPADEADELRARFNRNEVRREDFPGGDDLWRVLTAFASYAFNKAHAASYARLAWRSAWLKTHHPAEFACAVLNHYGGMYPLRTVAADFLRSGVRILGPSIERSEAACAVEDGAVRVGLALIKHLSRKSVARILRERRAGDLPETERQALLRSGALGPRDVHPLIRVRDELDTLGMHLSAHPMALLRAEAARVGCAAVRDVRPGEVRLAALVAAAHRVSAATQFVTFEDETGLLEARVPPPFNVDNPGPYLVEGLLRGGQLRVSGLKPFYERVRRGASRG